MKNEDALNLLWLSLGALGLLLGLFGGLTKKRLFLSEPILALAIGMALGKNGIGLLDVSRHLSVSFVMEQSARLAIAIQVLGVALILPQGYFVRNARLLALLLGPVMVGTWVLGSGLAMAFLGVSPLMSLLLGAILSPTDPILASSVATGSIAEQEIPEHLRHGISAESAANDGSAYLVVMLPLLLLTYPSGEGVERWLKHVIPVGILLALALGCLAGWAFGLLFRFSERRGLSEKQSFLALTTSLTVFVLGGVRLLGSDAILAVFVAGVLFAHGVGGKEKAEESQVQEAIDRLLTFHVFLLLGLVAPVAHWRELGPWALAFAILVPVLRRLPVLLLLRPYRLCGGRTRDDAFAGWFGPIGAAALFYALLAERQGAGSFAWHVTSLVVCTSVLLHGLTSVPLSRFYGRRARARCKV